MGCSRRAALHKVAALLGSDCRVANSLNGIFLIKKSLYAFAFSIASHLFSSLLFWIFRNFLRLPLSTGRRAAYDGARVDGFSNG